MESVQLNLLEKIEEKVKAETPYFNEAGEILPWEEENYAK